MLVRPEIEKNGEAGPHRGAQQRRAELHSALELRTGRVHSEVKYKALVTELTALL